MLKTSKRPQSTLKCGSDRGFGGIDTSSTVFAARLSLAAAIGLALSAATQAKDHGTKSAPQQLPKVSVQAETDNEYKTDQVSSPKFTAPLLNTPQTVSVVTKEVIAEQGALSLSDTLRNTPGITFQLGENGNTQSGDTIFMRGFDTQNSIFVDGIRDLNPGSRDVFNLEQVEIFKGPAGADNGRGATSGYVNLVSKLPQATGFTNATTSYGSEDRKRITADFNHAFDSDAGIAFRLNAMGQNGGVAGRDVVERESWGFAPSLAVGLDSATRWFAFSQHIRQDNTPDGAVSAIGVADHFIQALADNGIAAQRVDQENFYGLNSDYEDISADQVTLRFEHDFSPALTLRNTARYAEAEQERILTAPLQSPTVADGNVLRADPATWTVNRSRQASFRENKILVNQTNLTATFATGSMQHSFSGGMELMREKQFTPLYGDLGTPVPANLYNPDPDDGFTVAPAIAPNGAFTDGRTDTGAVYAFDTMELNDSWQITGGLRIERYDTETQGAVLSTATSHPSLPVGTLVPLDESASDTLFSWKLGAVFKPLPNGSVYLSYANSLKPPGGDNFALAAGLAGTGGPNANINNPALDPQKARNIELGTKWDLLGGRLAATAALFRSENENELAQLDPNDPSLVIQYGEKRIEGVELGVVGSITDAWQISAGLTRQNAEVTEGSTSATVVQSGALINFSPKLSATVWTTYDLPLGLTIGGGMRYVDTQTRQINTIPAAGGIFNVPSYTVLDAYAAYDVNDSLGMQLNVYNVTDEFYVGSVNNSGHRYFPGTPRSYLLTASFRF